MKRSLFLLIALGFSLAAGGLSPAQEYSTDAVRIAHYVPSTHWDREWYEPFQGFRMRLVSLIDEVFNEFDKDPAFATFVMDGQTIPAFDYLEIRPENRPLLERYVREGRFRLGPWYVLPDEWLVSGESLVRNLQTGIMLGESFAGKASRAGFMCDMFGHTGQMPQIFDQMGVRTAFVWRGTEEKELAGHFNWTAPDGTILPTYRFGKIGYCSYVFEVRKAQTPELFDVNTAVDRLVEHTLREAARSKVRPILLFDGGDHMEIEPETPQLISLANEKLKTHGIRIVHSDLDRYMDDLLRDKNKITKVKRGELRESAADSGENDQQWLIPGVLSSRIHLKQMNARCEDELCLWAEPFSTFASALGQEYPSGYLLTAWKHLLENHPHDSICGCSIDQVHKDMEYRFDQSYGISSRLTKASLKTIARAACPAEVPDGAMVIAVFNPTSAAIDQPVDIDVPLPTDWPSRYNEFFGYEEKFSFVIEDREGRDIPYQLIKQTRDRNGFYRERYHFPQGDTRHIVSVTCRLKVPPFGYTTVLVKPHTGPTRYSGSMKEGVTTIGNEYLSLTAEANGTLTLLDKRTGTQYKNLLIFEDRADIGDGWYHGVAVNDRVCLSSGDRADIEVISDGIGKTVLRITNTMHVPEEFDFRHMERSRTNTPLVICSDITLRKGCPYIEIETAVENTVRDHRVRVLFPTGLAGETYLSDAAYDVVERPVSLPADNDQRRELDIETRPQISWTAFGDGRKGLAIVSRGLPESAVIDTPERTIALTLFRSFRRAVFSNDNEGGQILGNHTFRYRIVPVDGQIPVKDLFIAGQRIAGDVRTVDIVKREYTNNLLSGKLPGTYSFLDVGGDAVVTSVQNDHEGMIVRFFNPLKKEAAVSIKPSNAFQSAASITLDGRSDSIPKVRKNGEHIEVTSPPKHICTVLIQ